MSRVSKAALWALATACCSVAVAAPAQAKVFKVTGQQTTVTPTAKVTQFLSKHSITVSVLGPATLSNGTVSLPIVRGKVAVPSMRGRLVHKGGIQFATATRKVALRGFVLSHRVGKTRLSAVVAGRRFVVAKLTAPKVSISGKTGTLTGELRLSARAAHRINRVLGIHAVKAGADLGALTSTVTVA
jgi:hypothetical protein